MNNAVFCEKGKWSKCNTFLPVAIMGEYKLGGFQLALLLYIIACYDKEILTFHKKDIWVSLSYEDIAHKLNTNKDTAKKTIKRLIELKLVKQIDIRNGRTKSKYIPNEELIRSMMDKYLNDCGDDKE